jgi:hypothetical protein
MEQGFGARRGGDCAGDILLFSAGTLRPFAGEDAGDPVL